MEEYTQDKTLRGKAAIKVFGSIPSTSESTPLNQWLSMSHDGNRGIIDCGRLGDWAVLDRDISILPNGGQLAVGQLLPEPTHGLSVNGSCWNTTGIYTTSDGRLRTM